MIKYVLSKNPVKTSATYGKWYARTKSDHMVEIEELAQHMASHNTPFSAGAIKGILTDMVVCIKELLLDGKSVKLPDLAIFSVSIKNKNGGADTLEEFQQATNIEGLRLRCRATGSLKNGNINGSLQRATVVEYKKEVTTDGE